MDIVKHLTTLFKREFNQGGIEIQCTSDAENVDFAIPCELDAFFKDRVHALVGHNFDVSQEEYIQLPSLLVAFIFIVFLGWIKSSSFKMRVIRM